MRRELIIGLALLLAFPATAHMFNHHDRHDDCEAFDDKLGIHPNDHHVNDGHVHVHHDGAGDAHYHGSEFFAAGHTHSFHKHDPCNQVGMNIPSYQDKGDLQELSIEDAIIGKPDGSTINVILEGQAFKLPLLEEQRNIVVMGDNSLAAQGFPGSGTPSNPYIIEGYHIRNVMQFKDTNACIVVRNNVVYDDIIEGPIVDPDDIIDRRVLDKAFQDAIAALEAQGAAIQAAIEENERNLGNVPAQQASLQEEKSAEQGELVQLQAARASLAAHMQQLLAQQEQRQQQGAEARLYGEALDARQAANDDMLNDLRLMFDRFTNDFEAFKDEYDAFESTYEAPTSPPDNLDGLAGDELASELDIYTNQFVAHAQQAAPTQPESDANQKRYEQYQEEYEALLGRMDNYIGAIDAAQAQRDTIKATIAAFTASEEERAAEDEALRAEIEALQSRIQDAHARITQQESNLAALQSQIEALSIQHASLLQQQDVLAMEASTNSASLASTVGQHQELLLLLAQGIYEYSGESYDSLRDIALNVLELLEEEIENELAGRMIFDWNGQCVHAYHNVVQDLRVNRNNDRRGYATGGVIEENRFFTVGQIRHYDGEFRENEVGDKDILNAFLDPEAAPVTSRAINNDGANQGYFHSNLIYGGVDLDFHGHHHGAGFFTSESHYHGSDDRIKYMYDENGNPITFEGGHGEHGHMTGDQVPHHNHGMRWTSVQFSDNTVIDPFGRALRFEDRNHEGDDRFANSENMRELDRPHFHRTLIELEDNTVVGHVELDIVNADGVDVWSDDYSEVERDTTTQEVVNAVLHLGADIINSHQQRNQAWVDIAKNDVYAVNGAGINLHDVKEAAMDINDNRIFAMPTSMPGFTADSFIAYLQGNANKNSDSVYEDLQSKGDIGSVIGIQAMRVKDSSIDVCENDIRGAQVGLLAKTRIYEDVMIRTCSENTWGDADPRVDVAFTPYPKDESLLSEPVRELTEDTMVEHVANPVLDDVDDVGRMLM